jgi:hypothetical protein
MTYLGFDSTLSKKSEVLGRTLCICLPLADIERLSEDFVVAKYDRREAESTEHHFDNASFFVVMQLFLAFYLAK